MNVPSNTSVQCSAIQYIAEVCTRRVLFIGVHIVQQASADEGLCLFSHVNTACGVEIQVPQLAVEQAPVYRE